MPRPLERLMDPISQWKSTIGSPLPPPSSNHPHFLSCYVWVNPVSPLLTHDPHREPSHSLSAPAVPAWRVPLRTAQFPTLHTSPSALRICWDARTAAWKESCNFTTQYVSRPDDRGSVTGVTQRSWSRTGTRTSRGSPTREQFEQGATAEAGLHRAAAVHGFHPHLSLTMSPITLWAPVSCFSPHTSLAKRQPADLFDREGQDGIADHGSSAETDAPVVRRRWVSHTVAAGVWGMCVNLGLETVNDKFVVPHGEVMVFSGYCLLITDLLPLPVYDDNPLLMTGAVVLLSEDIRFIKPFSITYVAKCKRNPVCLK